MSQCKKPFKVPATHRRIRTYCSRSCYRAHFNQHRMTGASNERWRGGRVLNYGPGWKQLRRQIRERDKVCQRCGATPEENGRALDVHHKVPFRFSGRNDPDDLEALCRPCHMQADDHGRSGGAAFLYAAGTPPDRSTPRRAVARGGPKHPLDRP